jgi:hypothetical protein
VRLGPHLRFTVKHYRSGAKPYRLQRFAAFDVIGQGAPYLGHESALILRVPERSRGELGGPKIEISASKLRMLPYRILRTDRLVPNHLGRCGARCSKNSCFSITQRLR